MVAGLRYNVRDSQRHNSAMMCFTTTTMTRKTRTSIRLSCRKKMTTTTTNSPIAQVLLAFLTAAMTSCALCSASAGSGGAETTAPDNFYHEAPLPLADSALMKTGLYAAHDSSVSVCRPKHVHLSIGVTPWNSMTVSFSVPRDCYKNAGGAEEGFGDGLSGATDVVRTSLWYGLASSDASDILDTTAAMTEISLDDLNFMTEYNYTHTHHNHTHHYTSDYIFHVPIVDLEPSQLYRYQISVSQSPYNKIAKNNNNRTTNTNSDSNSKPRSLSFLRQNHHNNNRNGKQNTSTSTSLSAILSFQTSQLPSTSGGPGTKMAIVGDLGQTYNSSVTMLHMYRAATTTTTTTNPTDKKATLALCAGDMSYADSKPERWDSWFALIEPLLSHVPLVTAAGNHEIETSDRTKQPPFVPYDHRFRNPWVEPTVRSGGTNAGGGAGSDHAAPLPSQPYRYDFGNSYYDFVHGITHVVVLNCYADTSRGSPQHAWFESVFEGRAGRPKFDRRVTPWLVVVSHCPLYNTFSAHQNEREATDTLKHMECLFLRYGVNLVFSGHTHGYSRSTELAYGEVVGGGGGGGTGRGRGPVYITVGEGGNREGHCRTYVNATVPEEWIIKRDITEYGFGTVDFINATTLHWKWVRNEDEDRFRFTDEVFLENQWLEEVEEEVEDEENVVDTVFSGVDYFSAVGNGIGPVMVQKA